MKFNFGHGLLILTLLVVGLLFEPVLKLGLLAQNQPDIVLSKDGYASVRYLSAAASDHSSVFLITPTTAVIESSNCTTWSAPISGLNLFVSKHPTCTVVFDADPNQPGRQAFPKGTTFSFHFCVHQNTTSCKMSFPSSFERVKISGGPNVYQYGSEDKNDWDYDDTIFELILEEGLVCPIF